MKTFDELLRDAEIAHGHLCAGQVLGVRLAMRGLALLGIDDPRGKDRKRLITFVEIDRCATDAVGVVTGCRLGKRALKFRDWGKVAATFVDLESGRAIRVCAKESSKTMARQLHPEIENKNQQQMLAYREMSNEDLFSEQWVKVSLPPRSCRATRASAWCAPAAAKESTSSVRCGATARSYVGAVREGATTKKSLRAVKVWHR